MSRGVLVHVPQQYWHFVVACCLPVIPESAFAASRASKHTSYGSRRNSLRHQALSLLSRAACGTLASAALRIHWLPRLAVYWLYMLITCMFLGGATDCFALLTTALLGMRLAPSFDRPYMSGSLTEFWSQRWNVTTTYLFRVMVYDPIVEQKMMASAPATAACSAGGVQQCLQDSIMTCEHTSSCNGVAAAKQHRNLVSSDQLSATQSSSTKGRQDQQQRPQQDKDVQNGVAANTSNHTSSSRSRQRAGGCTMRRFAGMQATFAVSSAWHLLLFYAVTGTFGWRWMWFFVAQGPLLMLEARASEAAKAAGVCMPCVLAVILTNLLLIVMADPLLITPVVESGVVDGCFRQARVVAEEVAQLLGILTQ